VRYTLTQFHPRLSHRKVRCETQGDREFRKEEFKKIMRLFSLVSRGRGRPRVGGGCPYPTGSHGPVMLQRTHPAQYTMCDTLTPRDGGKLLHYDTNYLLQFESPIAMLLESDGDGPGPAGSLKP
jgi:hypothetical protein